MITNLEFREQAVVPFRCAEEMSWCEVEPQVTTRQRD